MFPLSNLLRLREVSATLLPVRRIAILLFLATAAGAHDDQEIAAQIAPGYRSVALAFLAGGLNGIEAHSRIDVYATFSPPSGPKTVEIFQRIRVLRVERSPKRDVAWLEGNPTEAEYAILLQDMHLPIFAALISRDHPDPEPSIIEGFRPLFK